MIRPATKKDFQAIADLQICSWRSAYRGLLPDEYLGQPVHDDLTHRWLSHTPKKNDVLLVHETERHIDGFINVLGKVPAYVDNLHVDLRARGRGIGTALMRAAAAQLIEHGQNKVWLTVITANETAVRFYEALGAERGPIEDELLYGQPLKIFEMTWNDLPRLAGR